MKTLTMRDIAAELNLSQASVSYALRPDWEQTGIAAETRERIQEAAHQLGYVPHHAARSLRLGKTKTIALVSSQGSRYPFVNETIEQIRLELIRCGYHLVLEFVYQPADETAALAALAPGRCDGVLRLGFPSWARAGMMALRERGLPVVVIHPLPDPDFDTIHPDRREEGRLATQHLLEQGHRAIAVVVGPSETGPDDKRVEGCRQAWRAADTGAGSPRVFHFAVDQDVKVLWAQIKSARPRPTAVFVYNDELAVRLVHAIHRDGGRVPEDMAVVADGNTWVGSLSDTPITNVDQNRAELGRVVVARLLERMQQPEAPPQYILVKPFLVPRESSLRRG